MSHSTINFFLYWVELVNWSRSKFVHGRSRVRVPDDSGLSLGRGIEFQEKLKTRFIPHAQIR